MESTDSGMVFSDFPEDVQLCILSFLDQSELAMFASTSKRHLSLYRHDSRLWFAMCDRRWGSCTRIGKWGSGKISYKQLYRTLIKYDSLIGFWRRSGTGEISLVFFEWGPFYITGSRVSPSRTGTYEVIKTPFLWVSLSSKGECVNYLDHEGRIELSEILLDSAELGALENDLTPISLNFVGKSHVVIEESSHFHSGSSSSSSPSKWNAGSSFSPNKGNVRVEDCDDVSGGSPGSFPERLMSEIYQHFANATSPGGNGQSRRQRKREKERQWKKKVESEHLVKIINCLPTPARPLQGLWKGISDDMSLEFYLTTYDDLGGLACRRVGDSLGGYNPVFWTSDTAFVEHPFPPHEVYEYETRLHLRPPAEADDCQELPRSSEYDTVTNMLCMTSSNSLVIPGTVINPRLVEGRIWQYKNGTFGFGFLRNNYIIDLKHVAQGDRILDIMRFSSS